MNCWILVVLVTFACQCFGVEVHFEPADSGFFLKHSRQPPVTPEISNIQSSTYPTVKAKATYDSVLSVDRFTIVQTTQPVSIRASYGPFSTKQTVPARYIVPDAIENQNDYLNNTTAALLEMQQSNLHLDISAHLVRTSITQDSPVLRVLFHAGADTGGHLQRQKICVLLHVSLGTYAPLKGRCMPEGEDGVCVAEVVIPLSWWPPLQRPHKGAHNAHLVKVPHRLVQVSYSVFEPPFRNAEQCEPKVQIQPLTSFAQVPLLPATSALKELDIDNSVTILMPHRALYPMSKFHVPVFLYENDNQKISAFTIKIKVRSGIRILGATGSNELWNISVEKENSKHTTARITALRKEQTTKLDMRNDTAEASIELESVSEIFSMLLEITDDNKETLEGGKLVWSVTYVYMNIKPQTALLDAVATDEGKKKLVAKVEINKDDIQAVLPMAKNWEIMNTAVLTGRQVAQAMKVFIVSQAGKIADVTLQSSCHAEDESVIKVSSSCSSVYVDGSEIRGSSNASIIVKYGTYVGLAKFIVWMPEFPLEVYISDFRLSQIKGWKVMDETHLIHNKQNRRRKKRSYSWGQHTSAGYTNAVGMDKTICRARYQQSPVDVYARFLAVDQNSGRISYFISRRTALRVTDLVQPLLRVADPKIANLKNKILQGKSMGRTDIQVLSPITGRVIGTKEIRVGSDKVSISKLIVKVVSGLQLTITPENTIENGYIAETSVTHKLTAQYQEGLLDIDLEFSDGSKTPLRDISVEDYFLLVESLDTEVVAFAPMLASHHPRVIAVGEGNGNLLRINLLLSDECRSRRNALSTAKQIKSSLVPLASALASVEVNFNSAADGSSSGGNSGSNKQEAIQNDGIAKRDRKGFRNSGDLADIIVGIPLKDSGYREHSKQHRVAMHSINNLYHEKKSVKGNISSMEIGMYVLLTAFCFAIIAFVISCVVYASKFRPIAIESGLDRLSLQKSNFTATGFLRDVKLPKEQTTNVHDWVWLGRSTLDTSSHNAVEPSETIFSAQRDSRIRITSNPIVSMDEEPINQPFIRGKSSFKRNDASSHHKHEQPTILHKQDDYRPPVPPHRNVGMRALADFNEVGNALNTYQAHAAAAEANTNSKQSQHLPAIKHADLLVESQPPELHYMKNKHKLAYAQNKAKPIVVANRKSPEQVFSPQEISSPDNYAANDDGNEMHNAELLVRNSNANKRNAFQFDSLTPQRITTTNAITNAAASNIAKPPKDDSNDSNAMKNKTRVLTKNPTKNNAAAAAVDPFVTTNCSAANAKKSQVKRATVVGNPMFSTSSDGNLDSNQSLGLDDLDMDYEQIMHYFDNLKESNA